MTKKGRVSPEKGHRYDASHVGPVDNSSRRCRDVFFCLIFFLYWVGMFLVSGLAFQSGDPRLLIYPKDTEGRVCGLSGKYNGTSYDFTSKAYLYYFNPLDTNAAQVCVSQCPTATSGSGVDSASTSTTICREGVTAPSTNSELASDVSNNKCAGVIYNSDKILYRCIPTALKAAMDSALTSAGVSARSDNSTSGTDYGSLIANGEDYFVKIVNDIAKTWYWILAGAGGALVITLFYTILIRYLCGLFVWTCILFSLALCYGFSVWLWFFWQARKNTPYATSDAQQAQWEEYSAMGMFIAMCSISGIMTLVMLFLRKRIRVAVQVMKEAMKAVAAIPTMLLFPFVTFFFVLLLAAFFFATMAFLASPTKDLTFSAFNASFSGDLPWQILQYYHIFGFLWTFAFLMGVNQVTIAGATATWYWARDKRVMPRSPVLRSFGRVLRYSAGSVALGALLIAVSQAIRLVLFRVQRTASAGGKNKACIYVLSCLQCCMACVESLLKFINRNAYIEIAIYGHGFCKSARTAFELLVRNALRLVAVEAVSDFILFAGKIFIAFGTGFAAYLFFNWQQSNLSLSYIFAPSLVVGVIAWMIAGCFFSTFGIAIDTIFLSFAEDCERNDGSADRPYFMSNNLMKITGLNNLKAKGYGEFITEDVAESREMRLNEF